MHRDGLLGGGRVLGLPEGAAPSGPAQGLLDEQVAGGDETTLAAAGGAALGVGAAGAALTSADMTVVGPLGTGDPKGKRNERTYPVATHTFFSNFLIFAADEMDQRLMDKKSKKTT